MNTITFHLDESLDNVKDLFVKAVLDQNSQNRTQTAKSLKIGIRTLQRYLKKFEKDGSQNLSYEEIYE